MTRARLYRRFALLAALSATIALPAGCSWIDVKQREFIFRPVKDNWRGYSGESDQQHIEIPVGGNGDRLSAWWMPAPAADAPALLYLHGARWNLSGSSSRIARYRQLGFSVLAIDYRGFGKSSGDVPSEEMAYEDARAAWRHLLALVPDGPHYIYGHSLGGAVAIDLARNNADVDGLILESTFTSIGDMARKYAWGWLPVELILTQRFDSLEKIPEVSAPTLFVHGKEDRFVPPAMSEQLFAASRAAKRLLLVDGAGHSNIAWTAAFNNVQQAVHSFFGIGANIDASTR
ncbi:MAG: alpha/beta fold hydrolase [Betaproteobacteria bacterium]|nr:alpha/beta fold hydrolase [Betaproteobacteria bacterium]